MIYVVDDIKYGFSYKELKQEYLKICGYSDAEFLLNIPEILHFACFVSYLKELGLEATVGDHGVIHELVHLLHVPESSDLTSTRELFSSLLRLD